jgi:hypothetical protein
MSVGFPVDVSESSHSFVSARSGGAGNPIPAVERDVASPVDAERRSRMPVRSPPCSPRAPALWTRARPTGGRPWRRAAEVVLVFSEVVSGVCDPAWSAFSVATPGVFFRERYFSEVVGSGCRFDMPKRQRASASCRLLPPFRWSSTSWIATTGASLRSRRPTTARLGFRSSSIPAATGKTAPIARSRSARLPVDRATCAQTRASDCKPGILSLRPDDARGPR